MAQLRAHSGSYGAQTDSEPLRFQSVKWGALRQQSGVLAGWARGIPALDSPPASNKAEHPRPLGVRIRDHIMQVQMRYRVSENNVKMPRLLSKLIHQKPGTSQTE